MNKAVPWNINGVGFDARDAAREAARRQGKSLGEWLHGVIADHAAELGVAEHDVAGQDRIDAVTKKLERMSARSADFDRRGKRDEEIDARPDRESARGRTARPRQRPNASLEQRLPSRRGLRDDDRDFEPLRATGSQTIDETDYLLEDAIASMEHRAARAERRTESALASFAEMLEANEAKRARERDAVSELSRKLSTIETKLTDKLSGADQNPIKGALARLEARLDTIGRRGAAEAEAHKNAYGFAADTPSDSGEPLRRLEDKLNSILEAVAGRPTSQASPAAIAAARGPAPLPYRRLGDAIGEIAKRQRSLEIADAAPSVLRTSSPSDAHPGRGLEPRDEAFTAMQQEIASLAAKIDEMRLDVVRGRDVRPNTAIEGLRSEIATMSASLGDLPPRGTVAALDNSIRSLTKRLEASRGGLGEAFQTPIQQDVAQSRQAPGALNSAKSVGELKTEWRAIATKVDDLGAAGVDMPALSVIQDQMHEIRDLITTAAQAPHSSERNVAERVGRMDRDEDRAVESLRAATDDVRAAIQPRDSLGFDKIERRLEALATKVDEAAQKAAAASQAADVARQTFETAQDELTARVIARLPDASDMSSLETLVRDLGRKIEAVQGPGAADGALDALQQQIAILSERFGRSEGGLASIGTLEHSMQDLFAHLEETRASVETNATRAVRDALRIAMDEGRTLDTQENADRIAAIRAMQDAADARTQSTLTAVHETLEKVVDRLSSMEGDIAEVRRRRDPDEMAGTHRASDTSRPNLRESDLSAQTRRPAVAAKPLSMAVGAAQPMLDPAPGGKSTGRAIVGKTTDADGETNRTDFISAARRAAKAAQTDPSVIALRSAGSDGPARAGLLLKSRDYVASHKKPVLLGFAALFVILGTMAIMQRMLQPETMIADQPAPVAKSYASAAYPLSTEQQKRPAADAARRSDVLSPSPSGSATPLTNPIPGSDPIQTGSIPSLPAFAARGAMASVARTGLPSALRTLADAGDGPAEYELGARYAEGKSMPRDFKLAAEWYGKAADQGLAPAQYRLASLYEKGIGVAQDKAKAKALYTKAADAGNPRAMHNLAVMLADGDGTPDYEGAATWFRKAAQYGVHDSEYNLAILLARGLGVPQSLVQSYQWFAIAADQNDSDAAKKRDEVGLKLGANDLSVAKALASAFRPRTANVAATEVQPPSGGWDGASTASPINSAGAKLSSL